MRKIYFLLISIAVFSFGLSAQDTSTPIGEWQTIDDETGKAQSIISIYEQDGKYFGRISDILTDKKDALCTECSGKLKNQPILGMVIVRDLEKDGAEWNGGTIFDPKKGSEYRLVIWYEEDADTLFVRGKHWTGLYRTQTWKRKKS